eukprot:5354415-Prorocentrum_lima.AAC.1
MVGRWCAEAPTSAARQPLLSLRTGVCHPCTRTYVRLLGPCFKTGCREPFRRGLNPKGNLSLRAGRTCPGPQTHPDAPKQHWLPTIPSQQVQVLFTLFSKVFSSFPHGTCSLSVSHRYLALDGIYHPIRAALPSNSTRRTHAVRGNAPGDGPFTLSEAPFQETYPAPFAGERPLDYNSEDLQSGLIPLQSPLLGES